jgi:hypothetical protein
MNEVYSHDDAPTIKFCFNLSAMFVGGLAVLDSVHFELRLFPRQAESRHLMSFGRNIHE